MNTTGNLTRRNLFALAAGGLLLGQDRASRDMIVLAARPEDLEMPLSGFADYITPAEHFFVRTHVYVPNVKIDNWRLKVEGEVASPLILTIDDIRKMPSIGIRRRDGMRRKRPRLV